MYIFKVYNTTVLYILGVFQRHYAWNLSIRKLSRPALFGKWFSFCVNIWLVACVGKPYSNRRKGILQTTTDTDLLRKISDDINGYGCDSQFQATYAIVATWYKLRSYSEISAHYCPSTDDPSCVSYIFSFCRSKTTISPSPDALKNERKCLYHSTLEDNCVCIHCEQHPFNAKHHF